jgi:inhibitor of KinA sporulation pathway (predicted exonuclease)
VNYIVLDLEWNQGSAPRTEQKPELTFEIIEIGAVKLDEQGRELDHFQHYVYPHVYHKMHYMTKEVTKITINELKKKGRPFKDVMRDFIEWCGQDYRFCIWGDMDLTELQKNCDYYNMKGLFPKPLYYYDLQKLFSLQYEDGKSRRNLQSAVEFLNLPEKQAYHGAYADACYTAEVFQELSMERYGRFLSVDYYALPQSREEELRLDFGTYTKYISREFETKELAMVDRGVVTTTCYKCHKNLRKKVRWFTSNGKQFYALSYCPEHGWLKGKIRMKKGKNGGVFVVKTEKLVDEAVADEIRKKQADVRKRRERLRKHHIAKK